MNPRKLAIYIKNALEENLDLVPELDSGKASAEQLRDFCRNLRIAGIGDLLLHARSMRFRLRLSYSGRVFLHAWKRMPEVRELSFSEAAASMMDAMAAGDFDSAREIAAGSRRTWFQGEEYEEEFLFHDVIAQLELLGGPRSLIDEELARWEAALAGSPDPRLAVCQALAKGDAEAFDASLRTFLQEREQEYEALFADGALAPEDAMTEGKLSIVGVALARIADRHGLAIAPDYVHVPSLTRDRTPLGLSPDAWRAGG
jgi:hypothetical protein